MARLRTVKVVALDTNGVLTRDVYGPALKSFVEARGGRYTSDVERLTFGSPHTAGGHIMSVVCQLPLTPEETIAAFLEEQRRAQALNPVTLCTGVEPLLERLADLGVVVTSYGGSPKAASFDPHLGSLERFFDSQHPYVDMGRFRPGMKEIIADVFARKPHEVVFVDDLNRVGEVARSLGAGFIGVPGGAFQEQQMHASGMPYMVRSLDGIDERLMRELDDRLAAGSLWPRRQATTR